MYNYKIIRTASYLEIYEYDTPIAHYGKKDLDLDYILEAKEKLYETVRLDNDGKTNDDKTDENYIDIKRLKKNRLNAKAELIRLIDTNFIENRTSFITLTTKENIIDRDEFGKQFKLFIHRMNYKFLGTKKRELKYIAVFERQKRGAYHVHMIMFDVGYFPHKDLLEVWRLGGVRINSIDSLDSLSNLGRYVGKYMEKGIGEELLENKHKKSYLASNNLIKPTVIKTFSEDRSIDEIYGYTDVSYESEYVIKRYKNDGKFVDNKVRYRKIILSED